MTGKHKKRDVLSELLGNPANDSPPGLDQLANIIKEFAADREPAPSGAGSPSSRKHPGPAKKKTTHYLSEKTFGDLDEAKEKIRELVPRKLKSRVSKSNIVNHALNVILKDFESKGERSSLVKLILAGHLDDNGKGK